MIMLSDRFADEHRLLIGLVEATLRDLAAGRATRAEVGIVS